MDEYYKKLKDKNLYSVQADFIVNNVPEDLSKEAIINSDLLCFYVAELQGWNWFPETYVYRSSYVNSFDFIRRLISQKHFLKVKGIFGVESIEDLKTKIEKYGLKSPQRGYNQGFADRIPGWESFIKIDDIGTSR